MSTNFDEFSVQTNTLSNAQTDQKLNEDGPATDQSSVKDEGLPQKQSFPSHSDTIPHEPSQKSVRTLVEDKSVSSVASKQNSVTSSTASHGSGGSKKSRQSISWRPGSISQPSRSTTSNESKLSVRETKILLYKMNNTELVNNVQELQKNVKHLELENMVFLHFLQQNDPTAVEAFESTMKNVQSMQDRASVSSRRLTLTKHGSRRESVFLGTSYSVIIPTPSEKEGAK